MSTEAYIPKVIKKPDVANMRVNYSQNVLVEEQGVDPNPWKLFQTWFEEAKDSNPPDREVNAMVLATSVDNRVSSRVVLMKDYDERGFVFYTNYESRKASQIKANPHVGLNFWWGQRSVRIEGVAEKVSEEESTEYYNSRPKGSRLGAWASHQSSVLPSRKPLEEEYKRLEHEYAHADAIPKPPFWGGFRVKPEVIEFWQEWSSKELLQNGDEVVILYCVPDAEPNIDTDSIFMPSANTGQEAEIAEAAKFAEQWASTLKEALQKNNKEITTQVDVDVGSPGPLICLKVQKWSPRFVILGTHGRGLVSNWLMGSVSQ
ncbi:pyridoxal 5'-phosphate synthase [Synchytrium microbalum]|uniref:pyridoxal 5'-phosphate synthase n=1 Tax=Synchytrium microbalum TaxID=1806994 RepID=A0A507BVB2_9FUNG|nr:pyridoxal 5'-phosphate synthase [Synchytrium microbalum]TPX30889.1 pyridoxal 5'-phosphate synthase [Synchytrium microbalum]